MNEIKNEVYVIGAGLAGSEAAYTLSRRGIKVKLLEMKPEKYSPAHSYKGYGELVCSNSLKAQRLASAGGLLKEEMRILGSLTMEAAEEEGVSAGGAFLALISYFFMRQSDNIPTNTPPLLFILLQSKIIIPLAPVRLFGTVILTYELIRRGIAKKKIQKNLKTPIRSLKNAFVFDIFLYFCTITT